MQSTGAADQHGMRSAAPVDSSIQQYGYTASHFFDNGRQRLNRSEHVVRIAFIEVRDESRGSTFPNSPISGIWIHHPDAATISPSCSCTEVMEGPLLNLTATVMRSLVS
jgi:hypothetical protein